MLSTSQLPRRIAAALRRRALVFTLLFKGLFHLYALFGNFMAGGIFTRDNVRHIRQLGLLALGMAVLQVVLPLLSLMLLQAGLIDEASVTRETHLVFGTTSLPPFITAGLILLASWVMEVGRKTKDEAEDMCRGAELVV